MIDIKPTSKGALCLVSTLKSGCPQADTRHDPRVDTEPHTPFSVGPIYVYDSAVRPNEDNTDMLISLGSSITMALGCLSWGKELCRTSLTHLPK